MWPIAAEQAQDAQTAIIIAVVGGLALVLVAVTTGIFSLLSARANRTAPSAPSPTTAPDLSFRDHVVGELAVARERADDADERDDVQDRRLDQIERHLDLENPAWRHDGR